MLSCFFLISAQKKEVMEINKNSLRTPLKCWDIYSMHLIEQAQNFNRQTEIEILKEFKQKFNWYFDIENLLKSKQFEALVLTDFNQNIKWVNKGFTRMTGYPANYTIGKKPSFLQGKKSSDVSLKNIREKLKQGVAFKETVINYRKNGEVYNCAIEIYPLKGFENDVKHFLALEKEIKL